MKKSRVWLVYLITNKVNGKVYVGQTSNGIKTRWRGHCAEVKRKGLRLYRALKKYGLESFDIKVLHGPHLSKEEVNVLEIKEILNHRSTNPDFGYNYSTGGECSAIGVRWSPESRIQRSKIMTGRKHTLETRKKISLSLKGIHRGACSMETRAKIRAANTGKVRSTEWCANLSRVRTGKKLSPETRAKLSLAMTGKTLSDEHRAKIRASLQHTMGTPEMFAKLSAARIGRKHSPETIAKIRLAAINRESLKRKTKTI
jgi:group I intron endonuclease